MFKTTPNSVRNPESFKQRRKIKNSFKQIEKNLLTANRQDRSSKIHTTETKLTNCSALLFLLKTK